MEHSESPNENDDDRKFQSDSIEQHICDRASASGDLRKDLRRRSMAKERAILRPNARAVKRRAPSRVAAPALLMPYAKDTPLALLVWRRCSSSWSFLGGVWRRARRPP